MIQRRHIRALAAMMAAGVPAQAAQAAGPDATRCAQLAAALPASVQVNVAQAIAQAPWRSPVSATSPEGAVVRAPFCRLAGMIEGDIGFEIWLPANDRWNQRLLGAGVGGEAGYFNYADMARGVSQGFVTASSDTGHRQGERWIDDSRKAENYAQRAYHLLTQTAKAAAQAYYGRAARFSYFIGCSGGGRQGLREMQLYPADYDGALIGAPGQDVPLLAARLLQVYLTQVRAGASALTSADWDVVARGAVASCDAGDGLIDGVIADPRRCAFTVAQLACAPGQTAGCLPAGKIATAQAIIAPLTDSAGRRYDHGLLPGITARPGGLPPLPVQMFGQVVHRDAGWNPQSFDIATDLPTARAAFPTMDATSPDLAAYAARGGKLMLYQGWVDASVQPEATIGFFETLRGAPGTDKSAFARLYMVPGMTHCRGGDGTDAFGGSEDVAPSGHPATDMLAALIGWVEQGRAPGPIVAARRTAALTVDRTRPLCPYPQEAVARGRGSTDQASGFRCVATPTAQLSASFSGSKSMTSAQAGEGAAPLFPVTRPIAADAIAPAAQTSTADYAALTARNRAIMTDFVTLLYERRQPRVAFEKYVHPDYKQHNPIIADGRENALKWLEPVFAKATTEIQVRRVLVDGDYATVQIIGRMGPDDPGSAVINIFHLKDGLITEHWDVTQAMPKETASGRPLG